MRTRWLLCVGLLTLPALAGCANPGPDDADRQAGQAPVDVDGSAVGQDVTVGHVCFRVHNQPAGLPAQAATEYRLYGRLYLPPGELPETVVVLVHGGGIGLEVWDLRPGIEPARDLARAGYAVVAYDRLGYNNSIPPNMPAGGLAFTQQLAMLHEVVQHLKVGTADMPSNLDCSATGSVAPRFSNIVLAGLSLGGGLVGAYPTQYGDVAGIVQGDWPDAIPNPIFVAAIAESFATRTGPDGYVTFPVDGDTCRELFLHLPGVDADIPPRCDDERTRRGPTGDGPALGMALSLKMPLMATVDNGLPVLLTYADHTTIFADPPGTQQGMEDSIQAWKTGCPQCIVDSFIQEDAGHVFTFHRSNPTWTAAVIQWMVKHDLHP